MNRVETIVGLIGWGLAIGLVLFVVITDTIAGCEGIRHFCFAL